MWLNNRIIDFGIHQDIYYPTFWIAPSMIIMFGIILLVIPGSETGQMYVDGNLIGIHSSTGVPDTTPNPRDILIGIGEEWNLLILLMVPLMRLEYGM